MKDLDHICSAVLVDAYNDLRVAFSQHTEYLLIDGRSALAASAVLAYSSLSIQHRCSSIMQSVLVTTATADDGFIRLFIDFYTIKFAFIVAFPTTYRRRYHR